jgi:hypothetical protein
VLGLAEDEQLGPVTLRGFRFGLLGGLLQEAIAMRLDPVVELLLPRRSGALEPRRVRRPLGASLAGLARQYGVKFRRSNSALRIPSNSATSASSLCNRS